MRSRHVLDRPEFKSGRQPLRYAGYAYDAHSATYYLSARHYDPATARFLTKDPARDDGEESAYQYCAGDPVGSVDPTGEASVWVPTIGQAKSQWCWAAAAVAVIRAMKGKIVSQSAFVKYVKGKDVNQGGTHWEIKKGLKHGGVATVPTWYWTPGWQSVQGKIKARKPMIACISWHAGGGHAVVIYGTNDKSKGNISWMDPLPVGKGSKHTGSWDYFKRNKRWKWARTIAPA